MRWSIVVCLALAGCGSIATLTIPSGEEPFAIAVDPAKRTLYTANGDNTISAFDLRDCNAGQSARLRLVIQA